MGIKAPVAIADGEHDEAIRREHTEEMAKLIPGAKLIILPNVSHFAFWQDPALFNKAVLDFLAGKLSAGRWKSALGYRLRRRSPTCRASRLAAALAPGSTRAAIAARAIRSPQRESRRWR